MLYVRRIANETRLTIRKTCFPQKKVMTYDRIEIENRMIQLNVYCSKLVQLKIATDKTHPEFAKRKV